MLKRLLMGGAFFALACVFAQENGIIQATTFDEHWIEDQRVLGVNKEPGRATFMPYASRRALLADGRFRKPWLDPEKAMSVNLNGTWKFRWVKGTAKGPGRADFQAADLDDSSWDDIRVPMSWEMAGRYNKPTYNNTGYPFRNEPPRAMWGFEEHGIVDHNAVGFYRRSFKVPADWHRKRVFIHFDGVYSCCAVWVNGGFAGYSQGANNVAEFEIGKFLKNGDNQLSVKVYRWCDGSYLEGQDMWRMSGIHRDVYLFATPKTFVADHYITTTEQSDNATAGRLNVALRIDNRDQKAIKKTFRVDLLDADGRVKASVKETLATSDAEATLTLATALLTDLVPWNAEKPYLYDVVVTQVEKDKEEMVFATKYGFRNIQLVKSDKARYFSINGKRIFFKGANAHDAHPLYGRYMDAATMLADVKLMKRANLNMVRTSHYPRTAKMNAIFDAYGLYVMDEADLECHGNQGLTRDPAWTAAFVDRNVRMVLRDRNHPSVVFWSLGNENGHGDNMLACYEAIRKLDARFIHCHGEDRASDMYSEMYTSVHWTNRLKDGKNGKPFFICEYAHAMGQAVGNLTDYWKAIESSSSIVGACIWDWVDQAVYDPARIAEGRLTDKNGFHYWTGGYDYDPWFDTHRNNDKSFQGNYLNNGIIGPGRKWTAKLAEVKKVYQHVDFSLKGDELTIRNKYPFCDLSELFVLRYKVLRNGEPVEKGNRQVAAPPLGETTVRLPIQTPMNDGAEYALNVALCLKEDQLWAKRGFPLADEQFLLTKRPALPKLTVEGRLAIKDGQVAGEGFRVRFNDKGAVESYIYHGRELLAAAPEYNDFRRIDNDTEGKQALKDVGDAARGYDYADPAIDSHRIVRPLSLVDGVATLAMEAKGRKTDYNVTYKVYPNGVMDMTVVFMPQRRGLRRLGLGLQFAPGFEEVSYYARGPWSNYKDRQTGSYLGRYTTTVRDMVDENIHPQSYGDRLDLRSLTLKDPKTGHALTIDAEGMVGFSLSHFNELDWNHITHYTRLHWSDLKRHPQLFAHFDYWVRGIGNNSCFSDCCLPRYETPYPGNYQGAEKLAYTLRFTPKD